MLEASPPVRQAVSPSPGERSRDAARPIGLCLRDRALSDLAEAWALLGQPGDARHAGVHQARKRLRQVRAAMALAQPALGEAGRRIDAGLGGLCRGLSGLRDAQALVEALQRLQPDASPELARRLPLALDAAIRRRDAVLARALARDPDFARRRARLDAFAARLGRLDWSPVHERDVAAALAHSERRLLKARRRVARRPGDDERWHRLRRRLRRLRQQQHLLGDLAPTLRPRTSASAREAEALGWAQDDALLLRHCGPRSPFPPPLRRRLRALALERLARARDGRPG